MGIDERWGRMQGRPGKPFLKMLTDSGDDTGDSLMNKDHSGAPQDYWIAPPAGVAYRVTSLRMALTLSPSAPDCDDFGSINGGLANGIQFKVEQTGTVRPMNDKITIIKNHCELAVSGFDLVNTGINGANLLYIATLNFIHGFGWPMSLYGDKSERLTCTVNDNLSSLHVCSVGVIGIRQAFARNQQL